MVDNKIIVDFIHEIEAVNDRKEELAEQLSAIGVRARDVGIDMKAIKQVIKFRKMKQQELSSYQLVLQQYMEAAGVL